jgi:hypothetical protein
MQYPQAIAVAAGLLAATLSFPVTTRAQAGATGKRNAFWDRHRKDHPKCKDIVDRHEAKTRELEAEAEGLRHRAARNRHPDTLNKLAQERSIIMAELQDCILQNYSGRTFRLDATHNEVGLPAMKGETEFGGSPFRVTLEAGHYLGDKVKGVVTDHPTYDYAWGNIDPNIEGLFHVTRVRYKSSRKTKAVDFNVPMNLQPR